MESNKINIKNVICSVDDYYEDQLFVMLTSLYVNNKKSFFHVYIMCEKLNELFENKINHFFKLVNNLSYEFIFLNDELLDKAIVFGHVSKAAYYRLLIPKFISKSIDRILYLDLDLVITSKIDFFWNCEIERFSHLGVVNLGFSDNYKENLGISPSSNYFNSGVLMINLNWWRDFKVYEKSSDFITKYPNKIILWDQDVLNFVLESKWYELPYEFNSQEDIFRKDMFKFYNPKNFLNAFFNPVIIHYTGGGHSKPWHKECRHLLKNYYIYYSYLAKNYQKDNSKWFHFFGYDLKLNFFTVGLFHIQIICRKFLYLLISKMKLTLINKILFK